MPRRTARPQPRIARRDLWRTARARGVGARARHERGRDQERAAAAARVPARVHRAPPAPGGPAMNDGRDPAAERLLDAALEEVLGGRAHASPPPRQRWLAAALVLLAVS